MSDIDRQLEICRQQLPDGPLFVRHGADGLRGPALDEWLVMHGYKRSVRSRVSLGQRAVELVHERVIAWAKATRPQVMMPCPTCNGTGRVPLPIIEAPWAQYPCRNATGSGCAGGRVLDPEALAVVFDEIGEQDLWDEVHAFQPMAKSIKPVPETLQPSGPLTSVPQHGYSGLARDLHGRCNRLQCAIDDERYPCPVAIRPPVNFNEL